MRPALPLALVALLAAPVAAQVVEGPPPTAPGLAGAALPPLLDREVFFGDPAFNAAQISPDGRFITFRRAHRDVMNVWVKGVDEPFEAARPLTADRRPVPGYFWSRDGRHVLYVQDRDGDENYHVYAVDLEAEADTETGVPPARDLTPVDGIRAQIFDVPKDAPGVLLVGINDRDAAWHDVYRVDIATGERTLVVENTGRFTGLVADDAGAIHLVSRTAEDGSTELLRVENGAVGEVVYTCTVTEDCYPVRLHPDGRRVYLVTNAGARDLTELVLLDPATRVEELVERDPEGEVDFGEATFSEATGELVLTSYEGDRTRLYPKTDAMRAALAFLEDELPDGELGVQSATADDRVLVVSVSRDVDPGAVYLYDRDAGTATFLYRGRPTLPTEHLAAMRPVRYRARDGRMIPAYLTLPPGVEPRSLPTVILPHGGPWARDTWGYNGFLQFLANRGYAVLDPNFRGSTGYGKDFLNAGNGQWGTGAMQHDISDGVQYLIEQGIADPARVGIMGGSYGGYAVLAGLTYTPELYAAGVDLFGPSNLLTLLETIPPYWAQIRQMFYERMGNPETAEGRAQLVAQSPLHVADRIRVPLLIFQGANDPRVKQAESDQIVIALRDRGYPVEYLVAPDEGHGIADETNRLAVFAAIERFLAAHLGGRYQPDVRPELQARLEALTVDPATVALAAPVEAAAGGTFDVARLAPRTLRYAAQMRAGGQTIDLQMVRTLADADADGRPAWLLVDAATTPMGVVTDSLWLDRATFAPLRRSIRQGPAAIALAYTPERVTGAIAMPGQTMPYDVALEAPLAVEGPSLDAGLGALPLGEGYRATFAGLDLMPQRPVTFTVEVTGSEAATSPAGTFDAWVVRLTKGDGTQGGNGTLWVAKEGGMVVRSEMELPPSMGGGTGTVQLTAVE
jgi:dipeptidyl aminopeptidase/acylaminoacyl peptidase